MVALFQVMAGNNLAQNRQHKETNHASMLFQAKVCFLFVLGFFMLAPCLLGEEKN